jgi:aminocarboxymuconate-semialdehyde decarboxylase
MTVIDCQWHWYPGAFCESQLGRRTHPLWRRDGDGYEYEPLPGESWRYTRDFVDLERQFEVMDAAGIDMVVASSSILADVTALEPSEGREVAEQLNDELAAAQRAHPDRILGLATLPLQSTDAAIEVLDDAVERLGLVGVLIHSNAAGGSIADPDLWPVYERIDELGVPAFLHPTRAFVEDRVQAYALEPPLSYMFDTTVAAASMVLSGLLDAVPGLKVVHPHLGGALPYLVDRVDVYRRLGRWQMEGSMRDYLRRFYTDTVSESPGALRMAIELYGLDRLLFSTDFPYFPARDGVEFVLNNLDAADAQQVLEHNARALLELPA